MSASPRWSSPTKQLVAAALFVVAALLLYSFRTLVIPVVLVLLFAYVFAPVVGWMARRLHIGRTWSILIIYVIGLGGLATLPAVTVPIIVNEIENLFMNLEAIAERALAWVQQFEGYRVEFMGYVFSVPELAPPSFAFDLERLMNLLNSTISPLAGGAFSIVRTLAEGVGWLVFMGVMGFYLLRDAHRLIPTVLNVVPEAYRSEAAKLIQRVNRTWNAFLRGQLVLCIVIGLISGVAMGIVGIRFAVALGIVAGVLEIIPSIGPVLASVPAILLALFQGSSYLPLSKFGTAVLVAGLYWLIQSIENNFFVPRIIGSSLNLHPFMVIIGVLAGATLGGTLGPLGGVLGALLAAPLLATFRHLLRYVYCKLADLDPFPEPLTFEQAVRARGLRAVLFDLDGTLIDSDDTLVERWGARLERIPLVSKLYRGDVLARRLVMSLNRPLNGLITVMDVLRLDGKLFAAREWLRLMRGERKPEQLVAIDGAVEMVRELSQCYDLAITTTRSRAVAQRFLEEFDLDGCFKAVVTREDVRRLKPHPEPVRRAAQQLACRPEECLMVGDTGVDVRAGKRAGALTVSVLCGFGYLSRLESEAPDLVLETTGLLRDYLPCYDRAGQDGEPASLLN